MVMEESWKIHGGGGGECKFWETLSLRLNWFSEESSRTKVRGHRLLASGLPTRGIAQGPSMKKKVCFLSSQAAAKSFFLGGGGGFVRK